MDVDKGERQVASEDIRDFMEGVADYMEDRNLSVTDIFHILTCTHVCYAQAAEAPRRKYLKAVTLAFKQTWAAYEEIEKNA